MLHYYKNTKIKIEIYKKLYNDFFKEYNNVHLMNKNIVQLDKYKILGCTLWSDADENIKNSVNDFRFISWENYNKQHHEDKKWLLENYDSNSIILTHFPLIKNVSNPCYANEKPFIKNILKTI